MAIRILLVNFWPNSKVSIDLEKPQTLTGHSAMLKELDHPKTVCLECAEDKIIQTSENQVQIVKDYNTQICHSQCKMLQSQSYSGVPESVPQPALQKCKAMDENGRFCVKGKCFGKQHGWEKHQHIR